MLPPPATGHEAALDEVIPAVSPELAAHWDREWLHYFAVDGISAHVLEWSRLVVAADIRDRDAQAVFNTVFARIPGGPRMDRLGIWAPGSALVRRDVVEVGCGCGFLGKQLGMIANRYLGVDYSELALAIARGNSPPNCLYLHLSQRDNIRALRGSYDTMVGRNFFIHQNYDMAQRLLALGAFLLRPGGLISADFYLADPAREQGVLIPARAAPNASALSCGYLFDEEDIRALARDCGLHVEAIVDYLAAQRRFALMRTPG